MSIRTQLNWQVYQNFLNELFQLKLDLILFLNLSSAVEILMMYQIT